MNGCFWMLSYFDLAFWNGILLSCLEFVAKFGGVELGCLDIVWDNILCIVQNFQRNHGDMYDTGIMTVKNACLKEAGNSF